MGIANCWCWWWGMVVRWNVKQGRSELGKTVGTREHWAILEGDKGTVTPLVDPLNSTWRILSQDLNENFFFLPVAARKQFGWFRLTSSCLNVNSVCRNSNVNTANQVKVEFRPFCVSPSVVKYTLNINNRQDTNLLAFQMFSFNGLHLSKVKNVKKRYHTKE